MEMAEHYGFLFSVGSVLLTVFHVLSRCGFGRLKNFKEDIVGQSVEYIFG
jgi:hypothetical protein